MLVKNAAPSLHQALSSVGLADHICLVDTGSEDQTLQIAHEFTTDIHYLKRCEHFAQARNHGLKHLQSDWFMVLDADESLTPTGATKLGHVLHKLDPKAAPYVLNLVFKSGRQSLLKRAVWSGHFGLTFKGRVHENLFLPDGSSPHHLDCWDIELIHDTVPLKQNPVKAAWYQSLIEQELALDQPSARRQAELYWHLAEGQTLAQHKRAYLEQAVTALDQAGWQSTVFDYRILLLTLELGLSLKQPIDPLFARVEHAAALLPHQAEGWYYLSLLRFWQSEFALAHDCLRRSSACQKQQQQHILLTRGQLRQHLNWLAVRILAMQGDYLGAAERLEQLYQQSQELVYLLYRVFIALLQRDFATAERWWQAQGKGFVGAENLPQQLLRVPLWSPAERHLLETSNYTRLGTSKSGKKNPPLRRD